MVFALVVMPKVCLTVMVGLKTPVRMALLLLVFLATNYQTTKMLPSAVVLCC